MSATGSDELRLSVFTEMMKNFSVSEKKVETRIGTRTAVWRLNVTSAGYQSAFCLSLLDSFITFKSLIKVLNKKPLIFFLFLIYGEIV